MSKFATLDSMKKGGKDDPPKKANSLYVGSGINVIGRGDDGDDEADDVTSMFHKNKDKGVAGGDADAEIVICFYKNGFVVSNQGVLRDPASPENREFIAAINDGRLPPELAAAKGGADAEVRLEDHRAEEWVAPVPPPYVAFGGTGTSLGGGSAASMQPSGAVVRGGGGGAAVARLVDPTQPVTMLQVKLLDGRKEKIQINLGHTVGDLQMRVLALHGHGGAPFVLAAGFPPKPLSDPHATIDAAGLKGSAVTQQAAV